MKHSHRLLVSILAGCLGSQAFAQVQLRTLALSGQQAPGTPAGLTYSSFDAFSINSSGKVAMFASLAGAGVTPSNRQGIWTDLSGNLQLVMRLGDPANGQPGFFYQSTTVPNLSDNGSVVIVASMAPVGGGSRETLWTATGTSAPSAFAIGLTQVPGLAGGTNWSGFNLPLVNNSGVMAFRAILAGTGVSSTNANSHWIGTPGNLSLTARDENSTGLFSGVVFTSIFNDYRLNSQGTMVFLSSLAGTGITTSNDSALWMRSPTGEYSVLARKGDQAPGQAAGVVFSSIDSEFSIDATGRVGFSSFLSGPGITSANNGAAWLFENGATTLLVQEGNAAPNLPAGVLIGSSLRVTLGGAGTTVLRCRLTGTGVVTANRSSLFVKRGGEPLTLLARGGNQAPGFPTGANYDDVEGSSNVAINASGAVMLVAATTAASNEAFWLTDSTGLLQLIVREGAAIDVNDDPNVISLKTVSAINFASTAGADDGRYSSLSDSGELVFRATFTDSTSGAFIASLPPACDTIDFNGDGLFPDDTDLVDFLALLAGGTCPTGTCGDIDFNNDGLFPDDSDLVALLRVLAGGGC